MVFPPLADLFLALCLSGALAALAYLARGLSAGGALAGSLVGAVVLWGLAWQGLLLLGLFFVIGTAATRLGSARKRELGTTQDHGGRRSAAQVLANGGVAGACALLTAFTGDSQVLAWAFVAALAAAAADTVESEIGVLSRRPPWRVTDWAAVEPGTDGAVSVLGTVSGLVAALAVTSVASLIGLVAIRYSPPLALIALVATFAESVVGATWERRGWVGNDTVNLLNTLMAASAGGALALFLA